MMTTQAELFLQERGLGALDKVEVAVKGPAGLRTFSGIVMPRHGASGEDILILKLKSGYNVGISVTRIEEARLLEKAAGRPRALAEVAHRPGLPLVHILSTGGTIASYVDYNTGAVHPALDAAQLAAQVPEVLDICSVKAVILMGKLSEDMLPADWAVIARAVKAAFDEGASGVIVPHGTDTMGYTAAALSFMLRGLPGPVVLVGSQRSSDRPSSDASSNLVAAARTAVCKGLFGVYVVMHAGTSDGCVLIHRGVRVRKMHASRRDAFQSINEAPVGKVQDAMVVLYKTADKPGGPLEVKDGLDPSAILVQAQPGLTSEFLLSLKGQYRGVVLSGSGLGHAGTHLHPALKELISSGVLVFMTSQCLSGRVNMNVYSTGRQLQDIGVLPLGDCLPETALVKLMWALGQTKDPVKVKELMLTDIAGETSGASASDVYAVPPLPGGD